MGGASLEDLFEEPVGGDGLLLGHTKEGDSSSDESIGSPEVALPRGLGLKIIDEDLISGTALEQLSKVRTCVCTICACRCVFSLVL